MPAKPNRTRTTARSAETYWLSPVKRFVRDAIWETTNGAGHELPIPNPPRDLNLFDFMAKLSAHGTELVRYFSPRKRALVSVRSDGVTLHRTPYSNWKIFSRKKSEVTLADWQHGKYAIFSQLPRWARRCKSLPSDK
jgi:hypothetical protein